MRIGIKDYWSTVRGLLDGARVEMEIEAARQRDNDLSEHLDLSGKLCILDLANGQLRPQTILLSNSGHEVYGIDLVNKPDKTWQDRAYRFARWLYTRHVPNGREDEHAYRLVCGDVNRLPFRDQYFDLITSMSAFEHFLDVPAVVAEMRRVLRPGGMVWVRIHPFTCLSGGHNLSLTEIPLRSLPNGVQPWDHLRSRRLPITVPLNEWRIERYLDEFSRHFVILKHYCAVREGGEFLTPEIENELNGYSRDELTCCTHAILASKAK
jgi:SAM-dependent methyltransferase